VVKTLLKVENISCSYGNFTVFRDLSFSITEGSLVSLLGPSGCVKTTALRAIAGFEPVREGTITLSNTFLSTKSNTLPTESRHIGMVFQDYALFPHLNVSDNISFGLKHLSAPARKTRTAELLSLIRMQDLALAWPHELSGGQQQRVALARALAPKPKLLLLDEPFSNLDSELRRQLAQEVRDILRQQGTTAILVTHDQQEAFTLADEVGLMHEGQIRQWGSPRALYLEPAHPFVGTFISQGYLLPVQKTDNGSLLSPFGLLELELNSSLNTKQQITFNESAPGTAFHLLLRPWNIEAIVNEQNVGKSVLQCKKLQGKVLTQQFNGPNSQTILSFLTDSGETIELLVQSPGFTELTPGTQVNVKLNTSYLQLYLA
jgi:iron(III) transport system ATP-binding protein